LRSLESNLEQPTSHRFFKTSGLQVIAEYQGEAAAGVVEIATGSAGVTAGVTAGKPPGLGVSLSVLESVGGAIQDAQACRDAMEVMAGAGEIVEATLGRAPEVTLPEGRATQDLDAGDFFLVDDQGVAPKDPDEEGRDFVRVDTYRGATQPGRQALVVSLLDSASSGVVKTGGRGLDFTGVDEKFFPA
jgi:hypothetical protein